MVRHRLRRRSGPTGVVLHEWRTDFLSPRSQLMNEARVLAISVFVAAAGWRSTASADDRDPAVAEALFQQAKTALAAGQIQVACGKFRECERIGMSPGT